LWFSKNTRQAEFIRGSPVPQSDFTAHPMVTIMLSSILRTMLAAVLIARMALASNAAEVFGRTAGHLLELPRMDFGRDGALVLAGNKHDTGDHRETGGALAMASGAVSVVSGRAAGWASKMKGGYTKHRLFSLARKRSALISAK
jgi:hypothetical protein